MSTRSDRRAVVQALGLAALGTGIGAACSVRTPVGFGGHPYRLASVDASWDRVIRTVAGLRPFRPSGFVLRSERLGSKLLIHNYGHGGGGVTLSWGTGQMAVELALASVERRCAVLGCGAVGLATAWLLLHKGFSVAIYAKDLPPNTTSNIAGAQWTPSWVCDHDGTTPQFDAQLERASRLAYRFFQTLVGERYGVRWIDNYEVGEEPFADRGYRASTSPIRDLYPDMVELHGRDNPFHYPHVRRFSTMLIEPPVYLQALLDDVARMGGRIEVRELGSPADVEALPEPIVVNCTGLGARSLFGDDELMPMKGQLVIQLPQSEVDYIALHGDVYMFPRRDGILLGSTYERDVWDVEPTEAGNLRIMQGAGALFAQLKR